MTEQAQAVAAAPTEASVRLMHLARTLADRYAALPHVAATMVTGSVADGLSDFFSDVDMAVYAHALPSEDDLAAVRHEVSGSSERRWLLGDRADGVLIEAFAVGGVECQVIHATPSAIDAQLDAVLIAHEVATPTHKAMSGLLKCRAFHGEEVIGAWKARLAAFPEELAVKTVRHHLKFFPLWGLTHQFTERDATLFYHQTLVEAAQNVLGVLAGLNRVYYSTFQFKRAGKFVAGLRLAPPRLYERLEFLFAADVATASEELERLVRETIELVEAHMPSVDTGAAKRRLGWRQAPWSADELAARLAAVADDRAP